MLQGGSCVILLAMKVYVMRHGRTNWNEKKITQGHSQNSLSRTGQAAVVQIAQNFADTPIDLIVCSPLRRTVQTANLMNAHHHVKVVKDPRLIEIDQGVFSGQPYADQTPTEQEAKRLRLPGYGLETYTSVYQRVRNFADNLKKDYPVDNVLVVTHESLAVYLSEILAGNPKIDSVNPFTMSRFANAEIRHFEI